MAIASGADKDPAWAPYFKAYGANFAVPALFLQSFPAWFAGFAFAAIGIGALVPAAIMSIAAANLWTRNIHREFLRPNCTPAEEAQTAKIVSLVVKFGALLFIVLLPQQYAIQLQLLGGIWIIQTLPAVVVGLYTRWLDARALLAGWLAGVVAGTSMAAALAFKSSVFPLTVLGFTIPGYAAVYSLLLNFAVAIVATLVLRAAGRVRAADETSALDYV
jgi:SSS family solute:Na+ symporter